MLSAFKAGVRLKQQAGTLTVTKLFARNCGMLPGKAGCIRRQKNRADVTYWGNWYEDGSKTEEEELREQMGDKV